MNSSVVYELNAVCERPGTIKRELETVFGKRLGAKISKYLSELREVPSKTDIVEAGFSEKDAEKISALVSLGTKGILHCGTGFIIKNTEAAAHALGDLKYQEVEHFRCLALNSAHEVIAKYDAAVGSVNRCMVTPAQVFAPAMNSGAVSIIVAHNHPGGSTKPSADDISVTRNLVAVGKAMGINVLDSLVVSRNGYESII